MTSRHINTICWLKASYSRGEHYTKSWLPGYQEVRMVGGHPRVCLSWNKKETGSHTITPFCLAYLPMGNYPSASQERNIVVQLLNHIWLFVAPWTEAPPTPLPFMISQSLLKLMSIESVMLSNHLIVCHPLLLLPSIFPQHQGLFQWVSPLPQVVQVLELQLQHQSFQWIIRVDFP